MRNHLALTFAVLAVASGCSHATHDESVPAADVTKTPASAAAPSSGAPAAATGDTAIVHGRFAEPSVALDNARALAIADDQTTVAAPLDANGNFTLKLPIGASYRIVFVNQLAGGGQVKIGSLAFGEELGEWLGANSAGELDLGTILGNGKGGAPAADHAKDPPSAVDTGRAGTFADGANVALGAINVCMIWPSVQVYAGADVGADWADLAASAHSTAQRDDDKNCAYTKDASGNAVWGAPWSIDASGEVTLAGGTQLQGTPTLGFGTGLYGGFFKPSGEGFTIGGSLGGGIAINLGGVTNAVGGVGAAVSGAVNTAVNDAEGTVNTAIGDINGTVSTAINDVNGTIGAINGAISHVDVSPGISVGATIGVVAGVQVDNGWTVGIGAGIVGDVCLTAATCDAASACVASVCITP